MLKEIMKNTIEYVNSFPKKERKSYGQFFTPIQTAEYMASLIRTESEKVKILDPGAGNGLLTAAVVEHLIARGTAREISVVLYENDKNIQSLLKKNIEIISSYCSQKQVKLFIKTQKENFIVDNQKYWEMQKSKGLFDIVISNPPYLKIRKEAAESVCLSEIVHGQPNMYFLFMAMAVKMLRTNGEFVFITPRSWTSGTYFKSFRSYFMDSMDIQRVHLFESRNSVFKGKEGHSDDILQETMITYGKKSKSQSRNIIIAISQNAQDLGKVKEIQVESGNCLPEGKEHYFVLPSDEEDLKVLNYMKKMPNTVEEAGFRFKTGQVVEFRNKEYIAWEKKESTIPLLHSCNVLEGRIVFPAQTEKPQYFVVKDESKKNVMEIIRNGCAVIVIAETIGQMISVHPVVLQKKKLIWNMGCRKEKRPAISWKIMLVFLESMKNLPDISRRSWQKNRILIPEIVRKLPRNMSRFQKRVCSHPSCLMRFGRLAERLSTMRCRLWRVCCF